VQAKSSRNDSMDAQWRAAASGYAAQVLHPERSASTILPLSAIVHLPAFAPCFMKCLVSCVSVSVGALVEVHSLVPPQVRPHNTSSHISGLYAVFKPLRKQQSPTNLHRVDTLRLLLVCCFELLSPLRMERIPHNLHELMAQVCGHEQANCGCQQADQ